MISVKIESKKHQAKEKKKDVVVLKSTFIDGMTLFFTVVFVGNNCEVLQTLW